MPQTAGGKRGFGRDFALMVLGQVVSLFGGNILNFALSMYVLDATGSAGAFAGITAAAMVPTILLSPLGGVLADRVSRKWIMADLDFLTAALLLVFVLFGGPAPGIAFIAVVKVLLSVFNAFYQPAVQASIPSLVPGEKLASANGAVSQVSALAGLLGPVLGGLLYGFFGLAPMVLISAGCIFCSAVMECFLRIPFKKRPRTGNLLRTVCGDFQDAGRFMFRSQRALMWAMVFVAGLNLFFSPLMGVGLPYLVKIRLGLSSELYGVLGGAVGVGGILGAMLAGPLEKRLGMSRAYALLLLAGVFTLPVGAAVISTGAPLASFWVILGSVTLVMVLTSVFNVLFSAFVQRLTPPDLMGKVGAMLTTVSMCVMPLGQGLYGLLFDCAGAQSYLLVWAAAGVTVLLSLGVRRFLGRVKG